jgi:predicted phosphodiesterase
VGLVRLFVTLLLLSAGLAKAETLRIAVISDLNGSYGSVGYSHTVSDAIDAIIARHPDLVISTGDMVAGQRRSPKLTATQLETMWASFHATVSDPLARAGVPFLVTPGNHDASAYPGYEVERRAFAAAWADRRPEGTTIDAAGWPFRIATSLKGVLLVGMDATRSGPLAEDDMTWLRGILASEAGRYRRAVLFGHLPLMPIAQGHESDVLADPELFGLARTAGVDLWLSGHHHAFYSGTAEGILFVAQGLLGSGPRKLIGEGETSPKSFTWIEIDDAGRIAVSAFPAPGFGSALPVETLPATLWEGPFRLTRQMVLSD